MYNVLVAILKYKGILTEEEAKHLIEELEAGVFPSDFKFASMRVEKIFKEFEQKEQAKKKTSDKPLANAKRV